MIYGRQDAMAIEVFFGTNRKVKTLEPNQQPIDFSSEFNSTKPFLHFGKARISDNGKEVEKVYTSQEPFSDELCCNQDVFDEIQGRNRKGIDAILYFHGYHSTFHESLLGAAEIKRLYERESHKEYTVIVLSWPSEEAYKYVKEQVKNFAPIVGKGVYQLSQFLMSLCWLRLDHKAISDIDEKKTLNKQKNCGRLHIIAYSMGNYVLRHILREIRRITKGQTSRLFDEVLLVAADEDWDALEKENKLKLLPRFARRVSIYFNQEDLVLKISHLINGKRIGKEGLKNPTEIPPNVSLIDCSLMVKGIKEHDYHLTEPVVYRDIVRVLTGVKSEAIPGRDYISETNIYRLTELEKTDPPDLPPPHAP